VFARRRESRSRDLRLDDLEKGGLLPALVGSNVARWLHFYTHKHIYLFHFRPLLFRPIRSIEESDNGKSKSAQYDL